MSTDVKTIRSSVRTHKVSYARALVVHFSLIYCDEKLVDVARFLNRAATTISHLRSLAVKDCDNALVLEVKLKLDKIRNMVD